MTSGVEYDRVATVYDRRYHRGGFPGINDALRRAARAACARSVLEVGCGTGHWLDVYDAPSVLGADRSLGMLAKAAAKRTERRHGVLVGADAHALPFQGRRFDLVATVNALHHFGEPARFLEGAAALLRPGGALVVIGMDPSAGRDRWYLYDYFPETLPADRARFPPHAAIRRWMRGLGLERVTTRTATRIEGVQRGRQVLEDPILHRYGTSQLTLLDDAAFDLGMAQIHQAVERDGDRALFITDLVLPVTRGFVRA